MRLAIPPSVSDKETAAGATTVLLTDTETESDNESEHIYFDSTNHFSKAVRPDRVEGTFKSNIES